MKRAKIEIAIAVEHAAWRKKWPTLARDIRALLESAAGHRELKGEGKGIVGLVLADDGTLRRLNHEFRGKNEATNVLSFPDPVEPLGGIAIAFETVLAESKAQNKAFVDHAKHMILHGFLHLLGFDHMIDRDARLMEQVEIAILGGMGIPNPYLIETKSSA